MEQVRNGNGFMVNFGSFLARRKMMEKVQKMLVVLGFVIMPAVGLAASFDGDAYPDLIFACDYGNGNGQLEWHEYDPTSGQVSRNIINYCAQTFNTVAFGNLDGDQYPDLLVGGSSGLRWYEARSNDTVTQVASWLGSGYNVKDIKFYGNSAYIAKAGSVWRLDASGNDSASLTTMTSNSSRTYNTVAPSDFDNDGKVELVVGWQNNSSPTSGQTDLYEDRGTSASWIKTLTYSYSGGDDDIAGNFDGDSYVDVFISRGTSSAGKETDWYEADGTDNNLVYRQRLSYRRAQHLLLTDFDGDGNQDLIASLTENGEATSWYEATGDNTMAWVTHFNSNHRSGALAVGDWDGDGAMEVWYGSKPGIYGVQWREAAGDDASNYLGQFSSQQNVADAAFYAPEPVTIGLLAVGVLGLIRRR